MNFIEGIEEWDQEFVNANDEEFDEVEVTDGVDGERFTGYYKGCY